MIAGDNDYAHESYEDSVSILSQAIKSGSKTLNISDCLAIALYLVQTLMKRLKEQCKSFENSLIRNKKNKGSGYINVAAGKHSAPVIATENSIQPFLLTTLERWNWRINHKYWHGAISYFF